MSEPVSFDIYHPKPLLVVISGPSGVGKDAALKSLQHRNFPYHFVVTATTRAPRMGEKYGVDYFFLNHQEFQKMIDNNEFIEYAKVYDDFKGIPRKQIDSALASGKDVILRLDVQGAARIRSLFIDAVLIFLLPSSYEEWHKRLMDRGSESIQSMQRRVDTARSEMNSVSQFDYVIINSEGRLEATVDTITHIIDSEHHSVKRSCDIPGGYNQVG